MALITVGCCMSNMRDSRISTTLREVVLEVGGEGGSLTLVRRRTTDEDWQFRIERDETALYDLLSDEDRSGIEFSSQSEYVRSFEEALNMLDRYPWPKLYPLEVHPEYLDTVLAQVRQRSGKTAESRWRERLKHR